MHKQLKFATAMLLVCLLALGTAFAAAAGAKVKSKGVVINRDGDVLTVRTEDGPTTVLMTADTKVQQPIGLGARKKQMPPDVIIPGLKMKFEGVIDDQSRVVASMIQFDSDDLALAEVIQAGLHPTVQRLNTAIERGRAAIIANQQAIASTQAELAASNQRIAANESNINLVATQTKQRFSELTTWTENGEATLYFSVGDYALTADHQQALQMLAQSTANLKGYVIEVKGFADSTGRESFNDVLSKKRAESVVSYLIQNCNVPVKNIVSPGAMGETNPVASNETSSGRAQNRRVTVRVLVNKGVAGM